jgi:hypothetical protein
MKKLLFGAALVLMGTATGNVSAKECDGHHVHFGDFSLFNWRVPGIIAFNRGSSTSMYDPGIGCTQRLLVHPDRAVREIVTDLEPMPWGWKSFSKFSVAAAGGMSDSVTFRQIQFAGLDDVERKVDFRLAVTRLSNGTVNHTVAATYTEKRPDGATVGQKIVTFPFSSELVWMRFDWTPTVGDDMAGAEVVNGSTLRIRFVRASDQAVLADGSIALGSDVVPMTLRQGVLNRSDVLSGPVTICTAFPGQGGLPPTVVVPPPSFTARLCAG